MHPALLAAGPQPQHFVSAVLACEHGEADESLPPSTEQSRPGLSPVTPSLLRPCPGWHVGNS